VQFKFVVGIVFVWVQYFSRDSVTLLTEREDIHRLGWFSCVFAVLTT